MLHAIRQMVAGGGRQRVLTGFALAAALAGIVVLVIFATGQEQPPKVSSSARGTIATPQPSDAPQDSSRAASRGDHAGKDSGNNNDKAADKAGNPLPASKPASISIPAIDVRSAVIPIGKNPDGGLAVPEGKNIDKAAWYENSPTPGQTGPSVIEGHIDTVDGPSVFYRLAALEPGNKVKVARADGTTAVFEVNAVRGYPTKTKFPTELVYGGDLSKPSLRLITCSNFDHDTGHYAGNTVVYAHLTTVHKH